ncbi:MAG TPA: glycosyltransferase family 4 protein [Candidatus Krumholzibacteria bacterium]|nr:glycosyltransferase family 4 protein [Candidatus Krumholzibacteria bacterium]
MCGTRFDVAVLLPGVGVFGGVRRFIALGNEFVRRGHGFVIYHPTGEPPGWLPFAGETRPLSALPEHRHEVLICNNPPQLGAFENAHAGIKLFYFALEGIPGERAIARRRDWVIAVNSTGLHRRLRRRYGVDAEKAIGGVDLETFRPGGTYPPPGDEFRVMVFGRTSRRRKGAELAIRAVERVARDHGDVRLVLFDHVGVGNERDPRDEIKTRVPLEFHVNPSQDELAALYRGSHAFVSAERRAGWANTVAEAMACGTPVVCTRSGSTDIALPGETAWVARVRHPWVLARSLRGLRDAPHKSLALRTNALRRIPGYAWPAVADQLERIIARRLT